MKLLLILMLAFCLALTGCKKEERPAVDTSGAESKMKELQREAEKAKTEAEKSAEEASQDAGKALTDITGDK